jgi:hypothetical protein
MSFPQLVENSASYHLQRTLQTCHGNRVNYYYYVLNILVLLLFVFIVGITLYYCYANKPTEEARYQKMLKDQEFVVSKIRYCQEEKKQKRDGNSSYITDLPFIQP